VTTLFVTHDQEEAVVLTDRIALMLEGKAAEEQQDVGPPVLLQLDQVLGRHLGDAGLDQLVGGELRRRGIAIMTASRSRPRLR
jgi:hypothetical protein